MKYGFRAIHINALANIASNFTRANKNTKYICSGVIYDKMRWI